MSSENSSLHKISTEISKLVFKSILAIFLLEIVTKLQSFWVWVELSKMEPIIPNNILLDSTL